MRVGINLQKLNKHKIVRSNRGEVKRKDITPLNRTTGVAQNISSHFGMQMKDLKKAYSEGKLSAHQKILWFNITMAYTKDTMHVIQSTAYL